MRFCSVMEDGMTVLIIIMVILIVFLGIILFMIAPGRGGSQGRKDFYHLNLAHRGLHSKDKKIPENSMAAFKAAVEAGYGIELDIQLTKDEQVVVFHDDTLPRVCGVEGRVDDYTCEELQAFSLCKTDEKIPLFSDVLKLVDAKVPLLVELKNGPKNNLLCEKALKLLRNYKGIFCIESFSPFIVGWFKKNAPDIFRGQLSAPAKEFKGELNRLPAFFLSNMLTNCIARPQFSSYHKEKRSLTVKLCEAMGAMRFVWTVRPADDIKKLEKKHDAVIFEFYKPGAKY